MSKYPEQITSADLCKVAHIPDSEIERDALDTEVEAEKETEIARGHRIIANALPPGDPEHRMAHFRADAHTSRATDMRAFAVHLRKLLAARSRGYVEESDRLREASNA